MTQMDNANATLFFLDREGLDHDQCRKPDVQEDDSGDVGQLMMSAEVSQLAMFLKPESRTARALSPTGKHAVDTPP